MIPQENKHWDSENHQARRYGQSDGEKTVGIFRTCIKKEGQRWQLVLDGSQKDVEETENIRNKELG